MRVLVASDALGGLSSAAAGRAIAAGWTGADVRVAPIGEAGTGLPAALAAQLELMLSGWADDGLRVETAAGLALSPEPQDSGQVRRIGLVAVRAEAAGEGIPYANSSFGLGRAVATLLTETPLDRLYVDLAGLWTHDGGAGFLAGLGALSDVPLDRGVAGLDAVRHVDLNGPRGLLGTTELVGVVPSTEIGQPLLGLRGITSLRGRTGVLPVGDETARLLATDQALERFAVLAGAREAAAVAGAGACGGLGFAVLALGGRLTTGPRIALGLGEADETPGRLRGADLTVTGCTVFDFATRGGGVVASVARSAAAALSPCILLAGEVLIGSREMRTLGIEAAYPVSAPRSDPTVSNPPVTDDELTAAASRVARSWRW